jgi:chorismate-pyruvate lyase
MSRGCRELQRALARSPDTVTHLLETFIGEKLIADVVSQSQCGAGADHDLNIAAGETLVHRAAVLKGQRTDLRYVIAESTYVPDRLPGPVRARLLWTDDTIGRALTTSGLEVERRSLTEPCQLGEPATQIVASARSEIVWSRAYVLTVDGTAAFAVQEWFLQSALEAFTRKAPGAVPMR